MWRAVLEMSALCGMRRATYHLLLPLLVTACCFSLYSLLFTPGIKPLLPHRRAHRLAAIQAKARKISTTRSTIALGDWSSARGTAVSGLLSKT